MVAASSVGNNVVHHAPEEASVGGAAKVGAPGRTAVDADEATAVEAADSRSTEVWTRFRRGPATNINASAAQLSSARIRTTAPGGMSYVQGTEGARLKVVKTRTHITTRTIIVTVTVTIVTRMLLN